MNKIIKAIAYRVPGLRDLQLNKEFETEVGLYRRKFRPISTQPSVLHFSMNKAATQFVKNLLVKLSDEQSLIPVRLHDYAFASQKPFLDHLSEQEMKAFQHLFRPKGYLYTVFGGMIKGIPDFDQFKVLLTIRDPRDILVSGYYSVAISHAVPPKTSDKREEFLKKRAWAKSISIDEFAIHDAKRVFEVYSRYKSELLDLHDHTVLLKYEEMISDYKGWLIRLTEGAGMDLSRQRLDQLVEEFEAKRVKKEDKKSHHRKGIAGDYLNKLKPETIQRIEAEYGEILLAFGYKLTS